MGAGVCSATAGGCSAVVGSLPLWVTSHSTTATHTTATPAISPKCNGFIFVARWIFVSWVGTGVGVSDAVAARGEDNSTGGTLCGVVCDAGCDTTSNGPPSPSAAP